MKTPMKLQNAGLLLALLVLSPVALCEVSFSSYVRRNYKVLKATESERKTIAFQEKKMYRDVASVPADSSEQKKNESKGDGTGSSTASPDSGKEDQQDADTAPPGPNR